MDINTLCHYCRTVVYLTFCRQGRPEGGLEGRLIPQPPNENTSRRSNLFHYSLEGPDFTYGKQILHIS
jgi:hypothetical protein